MLFSVILGCDSRGLHSPPISKLIVPLDFITIDNEEALPETLAVGIGSKIEECNIMKDVEVIISKYPSASAKWTADIRHMIQTDHSETCSIFGFQKGKTKMRQPWNHFKQFEDCDSGQNRFCSHALYISHIL